MRFISLVAAAGLVATGAQAALIDFDNVPGVAEGLVITDQFEASNGVVFEFGTTGPRIAQVGAPRTAFAPNDTIQPSEGIGEFFLTDDGLTTGLNVAPIIMRYTSQTSAAVSGQVLDLDFDETFTIQALNAAGDILDTVTLQAGDPETGDQLATPWSITRAEGDIAAISMSGVAGPVGVFFGMGVDLIDTGITVPQIPLPPAVLLLGSGLLVLVRRARKARS